VLSVEANGIGKSWWQHGPVRARRGCPPKFHNFVMPSTSPAQPVICGIITNSTNPRNRSGCQLDVRLHLPEGDAFPVTILESLAIAGLHLHRARRPSGLAVCPVSWQRRFVDVLTQLFKIHACCLLIFLSTKILSTRLRKGGPAE